MRTKLPQPYRTSITIAASMLLWAGSHAAFAVEDIEQCVALSDRQPVELALSGANDYANCFTLVGVPLDSEVTITSMSEASFAHQIYVYEVNGGRDTQLIGSYDSNERSLTQVSVAQNGKPIAIEVSPAERVRNKHLKVQYLQMGSQPQVVIELQNQG